MSKKRFYKVSKDIYIFRIVGLGLGALGFIFANPESNSVFALLMMILWGFVWPHVAYICTKLASNGRLAERINLRLDCFFCGGLVYLVQLNPLAILLSVGMFSADRGLAYGWKFALECVSYELIACLLCVVFFGADFPLEYTVHLDSIVFLVVLGFMVAYGVIVGNSGNIAQRSLRAKRKEIQSLNTQIKEQVLVRYLPSEMVEDIFAGKIEMDHEPQAQTITVLFSDLSGFTKLGEQLSPKDYAAQLNEYLSFMNEIIFGNLGTVDKFMGDAIMVMFGAPKQMPPFQQAQRAITCARAMQNGLEALNEKWAEQGRPALSQRIGIHQGTAVVGNFGSERRSDYTCIGSAVNLASRIETACEVGKVYVSQSIHQLLPDETEEVGQFELKGIEGKTSLYQVVSDNS